MTKIKFTKEEKERLMLAFDMLCDVYKETKPKYENEKFDFQMVRQVRADDEISAIEDLLPKLVKFFE